MYEIINIYFLQIPEQNYLLDLIMLFSSYPSVNKNKKAR